MTRCKDGNWQVRILNEKTGGVSAADAALSVLMDIRDELKEIKRHVERIDKRLAKRIKLK